MQRVQTASPLRETSRNGDLTAIRGFGSGRGPYPKQTRRQREDHPRGAGQVDPTAGQPADGCRPGQRISAAAVGAIDLGHEPGVEPLPEYVGTAVGRLLLGAELPKRQVFAEVAQPRLVGLETAAKLLSVSLRDSAVEHPPEQFVVACLGHTQLPPIRRSTHPLTSNLNLSSF